MSVINKSVYRQTRQWVDPVFLIRWSRKFQFLGLFFNTLVQFIKDFGLVLLDVTKAQHRLAERYINNNDSDSTRLSLRDQISVTADLGSLASKS